MKKLALLLSIFSSATFAVPNVWVSESGMGGSAYYYIENSQGYRFIVGCRDAAYDAEQDHLVYIETKSGKQIDIEKIDILVDGRDVTPTMPSMTARGIPQWNKFTDAIKKGKLIEVYVSNKKIATFKPRAESREELKEICGPIELFSN